MIRPETVQQLCEDLFTARASLEGEFSGDWEGSKEELRELRHHLEDTFGVALKPVPWLEE